MSLRMPFVKNLPHSVEEMLVAVIPLSCCPVLSRPFQGAPPVFRIKNPQALKKGPEDCTLVYFILTFLHGKDTVQGSRLVAPPFVGLQADSLEL
jgi:hypothetical protein